MSLDHKQIKLFKTIGFFLMIGLMVFLNNKQESSKLKTSTESSISIRTTQSGIAASAAQIPQKAEGAIPIKLISNPNSNFLFLFNYSHKNIYESRFIQLQKGFLNYCSKIHSNFITEFLATIRNKDIR